MATKSFPLLGMPPLIPRNSTVSNFFFSTQYVLLMELRYNTDRFSCLIIDAEGRTCAENELCDAETEIRTSQADDG